MKRLLVICIVAYLALAGPACSKKDQDAKPDKPPKPVQVGEVTLGTVERTLTAPGSVVPVRDVWVSAEVSGLIVTKHVTEGQRLYVAPGVPADEQTTNLIASIDAADYERRLGQADATRKVAEAGLAQFTATQRRLADEIARKRPLHDRKIIADKDWDDLVTRKQETDAQVALYSARVDEARQAVGIARSNLDKATVRSPLADGLVAEVAFDKGEFVAVGQRLARVVNLDRMWVDVEVGESRLAEVKVGQHATFTVPAYPGEDFDGTVDSISPAGDPASRNFLVRLAVENTDHRLKGGMFAIVRIPVNTRRNVTLVPKSAVRQEGKFRFIFPVEGNVVVKRRLELGSESGDSVEVLDKDIKPGLKIVVAGVENLADGDRITAVEPASVEPASVEPGNVESPSVEAAAE